MAKKANCTNKVMGKSVPTEALGITRKAEDHYQLVEYPKTTQKSATMLHCTVVTVIEQQCSTTQRQECTMANERQCSCTMEQYLNAPSTSLTLQALGHFPTTWPSAATPLRLPLQRR